MHPHAMGTIASHAECVLYLHDKLAIHCKILYKFTDGRHKIVTIAITNEIYAHPY